MNGLLKRSIVAALLLVNVGTFVGVSSAAGPTAGMPVHVYADPSDFVVELDAAGRCGSKYFHIQRTNVNFKELTAVALTAFSTAKTLTFFVASCVSDRNIVSHGYASR